MDLLSIQSTRIEQRTSSYFRIRMQSGRPHRISRSVCLSVCMFAPPPACDQSTVCLPARKELLPGRGSTRTDVRNDNGLLACSDNRWLLISTNLMTTGMNGSRGWSSVHLDTYPITQSPSSRLKIIPALLPSFTPFFLSFFLSFFLFKCLDPLPA